MKALSREIAGLVTVWLLACPLVCSGNCSKQAIFFNVVGNDFIVRRNVRADDFNVKVDGRPTQVVSLSLDYSPRRIVLMVDTSDSMHASERRSGWGIALRTATFAFDSVPSSSSIALLTFGDGVHSQTDGFRDRSEVANKVLSLTKQEPEGPTAVLDSINQALSLFQRPQIGDSIFLVTDGVDNRSKISLNILREELISRGVRVFLFLVPVEGYLTLDEERARSLVESLTGYTGGYLIRIPWNEIGTDRQKTATAVTQIASQVQSLYRMELELPSVANLKGSVKMTLRPQKQGDEFLTYPRKLAPCAAMP
jgi:hypothetical protein